MRKRHNTSEANLDSPKPHRELSLERSRLGLVVATLAVAVDIRETLHVGETAERGVGFGRRRIGGDVRLRLINAASLLHVLPVFVLLIFARRLHFVDRVQRHLTHE